MLEARRRTKSVYKNKDDQISSLNSELDELKYMMKSRTEQANENIKKMAKINIALKSDLDSLKKVNNNLESELK